MSLSAPHHANSGFKQAWDGEVYPTARWITKEAQMEPSTEDENLPILCCNTSTGIISVM